MAGPTEVVIVANGGSNINSVRWALQRLGAHSVLSDDADVIATARRVILPGVGAAPAGMSALQARELVECLQTLRQPVLGVCLGMQLLFEHSEEGNTDCLGLVPGQVKALPRRFGYRVPHMGWNRIAPQKNDPLLKGIENDWFYFVHSYAADPQSCAKATLATCRHGSEFAAVVRRDNYWGVQFHPEKSATAGARLLQNFLELD